MHSSISIKLNQAMTETIILHSAQLSIVLSRYISSHNVVTLYCELYATVGGPSSILSGACIASHMTELRGGDFYGTCECTHQIQIVNKTLMTNTNSL